MAISRYKDLKVIFNRDNDYRKEYATRFKELKTFQHLETQDLDYPSFEQVMEFDYNNHIWSLGDRYYKLAHLYYGDSKYWWVIAWFNQKPTEQHIKMGDLIKIPQPFSEVLDAIGIY